MDDLISRQAAIKAIEERAKRIKNEDTLNGLAGAVAILFELPSVKPKESKYCDRNICLKNEYNGIGCDECEVTKSQEPKTGHWIDYDCNEDKYDKIKCSKCGHSYIVDSYHWCDIGFTEDDLKYCPNCGARMVEPQESEDKE